MVKSNIGPNLASLRDIRLRHLCDLEFDLSRSLKVKSSGAVGLSIYDFLLITNSNYMSTSHSLRDICIFIYIFFSQPLIIGPKVCPPPSHHHHQLGGGGSNISLEMGNVGLFFEN